MKKVRSASVTLFFTISVLLLSPSAVFAGTNEDDSGLCDEDTVNDAGVTLPFTVTDGAASITWDCDDLQEFSFQGVNYNDETEVHICLGFEDDCSDTNLDNDLDFSAFVFMDGSADEDANTISLSYQAVDGFDELNLEILVTLTEISPTVAEVSYKYTLTLEDGADDVDVKFFHTTDADVNDSSANDMIEYDGAGITTYSEGDVKYEVIHTSFTGAEEGGGPLPNFVGICDEDTEVGDEECMLDGQPTTGHLTLDSTVSVPKKGPGDWATAYEYDFTLDYLDEPAMIEVLERITLPDLTPPPPPQTVGGEFLPIETTSLLLAAASSPASWLATLTIAALGIGVYVFTRNPNNMRNIKIILRDYLDRF